MDMNPFYYFSAMKLVSAGLPADVLRYLEEQKQFYCDQYNLDKNKYMVNLKNIVYTRLFKNTKDARLLNDNRWPCIVDAVLTVLKPRIADVERAFTQCVGSQFDRNNINIIGIWHEHKYAFVRKTEDSENHSSNFPSYNIRRALHNFYYDDANRLCVEIHSAKNIWRGKCTVIGDHLYVEIIEGDENRQRGYAIYKRPKFDTHLNTEAMLGIALGVGASNSEKIDGIEYFPIMAGRSVLVKESGNLRYRNFNVTSGISVEDKFSMCSYKSKDDVSDIIIHLLDECIEADNVGSRISVRNRDRPTQI